MEYYAVKHEHYLINVYHFFQIASELLRHKYLLSCLFLTVWENKLFRVSFDLGMCFFWPRDAVKNY